MYMAKYKGFQSRDKNETLSQSTLICKLFFLTKNLFHQHATASVLCDCSFHLKLFYTYSLVLANQGNEENH